MEVINNPYTVTVVLFIAIIFYSKAVLKKEENDS
jgi:hypothetical protein